MDNSKIKIESTNSQKILNIAKEKGMVKEKEFIKFKGTGKHTLKFISDKAINGTNFSTGQPEQKMRYIFEENGIEKHYETAIFKKDTETDEKKLGNFVQNMATFEYEDILKLEYKPIPGTPRGFIDIKKIDAAETPEKEVTDESIPIIEEDSYKSEQPKEETPEDEIKISEIPF